MKREEQLALKKAEYEGKTFKTKHNDSVVVLEYISSVKIKVKLCSSGEVKLASAYQIRNGLITNTTTTPRVFRHIICRKNLGKGLGTNIEGCSIGAHQKILLQITQHT